MKRFFIFILIVFYGQGAFAACVSPTGDTGEIRYSPDNRVYQGCTARGWQAFHRAFGAAPYDPNDTCTSPSGVLGTIVFNEDHNVFQGCTSEGWVPFHIVENGPTVACNSTQGTKEKGTVLYNVDFSVFQGCTEYGWQAFHKPKFPAIKLTASDSAASDIFGVSVSISGNTAFVGARADDDNGINSGSVYVFEHDGSGSWNQTDKLTPSDGAAYDAFGYSVNLEGDVAIIGARGKNSNRGAAYVFKRSGGSWSQTAKLPITGLATGDNFGYSVAISSSGDTAVVGTPYADESGTNSGEAYIFEKSGGTWTQVEKLLDPDGGPFDSYGISVDIHEDTIIIGSDQALGGFGGVSGGAAFIFERSGGTWTQVEKLFDPSIDNNHFFGRSVSIFDNTVAIGAPSDNENGNSSGVAYIFERSGGTWTQTEILIPNDGEANDRFGHNISISGEVVISGAIGDDDKGSDAGAAYVFQRNAGIWNQIAKLTANDGQAALNFGSVVSISENYSMVGAASSVGPYAEAAYIFPDHVP